MRDVKKINTLNYPYHNLNTKISTKNVDLNLLSIDKLSFKNADGVIYNTKYITMQSLDSENIESENPICLIFSNLDGYIIEESNINKYLIFAPTKDNKKL